MDTWRIYMLFFQIFSLLIGLGIAFVIYYALIHKKSSTKESNTKNKRDLLEKPFIDVEATQKSLKIVPVVKSFFISIPLMLIAFFVGVLLFSNVFVAIIVAVLTGQLIVYIFKGKIERVLKR